MMIVSRFNPAMFFNHFSPTRLPKIIWVHAEVAVKAARNVEGFQSPDIEAVHSRFLRLRLAFLVVNLEQYHLITLIHSDGVSPFAYVLQMSRSVPFSRFTQEARSLVPCATCDTHAILIAGSDIFTQPRRSA